MWVVVQAHEILLQSPLAAHMPSPRQIRLQAYAGDPRNAAGTVHQFPTHLRVPLGTSHLYTSCAGIVSGATGVIFYAFVSPQGAQTGALLATASWTGACGTGLLGDASVC